MAWTVFCGRPLSVCQSCWPNWRRGCAGSSARSDGAPMKSDMSAAAATRNRRRTTFRRIIERTDRADKPGADEGMDFGTRIQCASRRGGRRDGLDVAKQEDVPDDAGEQIDDGDAEGYCEGVSVAVEVAGDDRRSNGGNLAGEVHDAGNTTDGAG